MDKQILNIDDTFEAINIIYFGSTEEVGISIYDKRTTNGAYGYLTFEEFEKLIRSYKQAKKYKYKDCLSCVHSSSEEMKNGDVLHCEKRNGKIVDDNYCCGFYKGD